MSEPDPADLLVQAQNCPVIKAAYASEDTDVIKRIEAMHPPKRCDYVKQAQKERQEQLAKKERTA